MSKLDKQKLKKEMIAKARKSFELEGIYFTDKKFEQIQTRVSL